MSSGGNILNHCSRCDGVRDETERESDCLIYKSIIRLRQTERYKNRDVSSQVVSNDSTLWTTGLHPITGSVGRGLSVAVGNLLTMVAQALEYLHLGGLSVFATNSLPLVLATSRGSQYSWVCSCN